METFMEMYAKTEFIKLIEREAEKMADGIVSTFEGSGSSKEDAIKTSLEFIDMVRNKIKEQEAIL